MVADAHKRQKILGRFFYKMKRHLSDTEVPIHAIRLSNLLLPIEADEVLQEGSAFLLCRRLDLGDEVPRLPL